MSSPQSYGDQRAALGVEVRTAEGGRYRSVPVATIPAARRRWVGASFDTAGLTLFAAIATAIRPALPIFTPTTQKKTANWRSPNLDPFMNILLTQISLLLTRFKSVRQAPPADLSDR